MRKKYDLCVLQNLTIIVLLLLLLLLSEHLYSTLSLKKVSNGPVFY